MGTKQQRHLEIVQTIQELRCFVMAMDDETWLMYEAWCLQHGLEPISAALFAELLARGLIQPGEVPYALDGGLFAFGINGDTYMLGTHS